MALSKATADQIVAAVVADPECQRVINWSFFNPIIDQTLPPVAQTFINGIKTVLEYTQSAGGVRNGVMLLSGKGTGDKSFDERICLGISELTQRTILKAMTAGKITGLRSCCPIHRETGPFKVHHQATGVRTLDDKWYVFDWHATLKPGDPVIDSDWAWTAGARGTNYVMFKGFN